MISSLSSTYSLVPFGCIIVAAPLLEASAQVTAPSITDTIYSVNNQNVSLDFDYFTDALNAEMLKDLNIQYIKLSDGKYYSFDVFTDALNAFDTLKEATIKLSNDNSFATPLTNVIAGELDVSSGKVISSGEVSADFEVKGIE